MLGNSLSVKNHSQSANLLKKQARQFSLNDDISEEDESGAYQNTADFNDEEGENPYLNQKRERKRTISSGLSSDDGSLFINFLK